MCRVLPTFFSVCKTLFISSCSITTWLHLTIAWLYMLQVPYHSLTTSWHTNENPNKMHNPISSLGLKDLASHMSTKKVVSCDDFLFLPPPLPIYIYTYICTLWRCIFKYVYLHVAIKDFMYTQTPCSSKNKRTENFTKNDGQHTLVYLICLRFRKIIERKHSWWYQR